MNAEYEPRILVIESSGRAGAVALAQDGSLLGARRLEEARRHARDLAPAVAKLLGEQGWNARQLNAVIVSRGPGSYTGLRVGIMSAKTLAYATGCALIGVETFAAVAVQAPNEAIHLDVLADAQQGKIYLQSFKRDSAGAWQAASALSIQRFDHWLAGHRESAWVSGPGLLTFSPSLPSGLAVVPAADWAPRPESLLTLGLRRWRAGERDDPWTLEPLYLRASAAEEQWQRRG